MNRETSHSASQNHTSDSGSSNPPIQRAISPLVGLLAFSAVLVTACTLPPYFILRNRLTRLDGVLNDVLHVARRAETQHAHAAEVTREVKLVGGQVDLLRGQVDKVAGDVRDVRSVLLKERVRLAAVEARFDALSEQLKSQEVRILTGLAAEQKRHTKTENEIDELRKAAEKVAMSVAGVASFIDQFEIEHGVPPEKGKESSSRVNALRDSAYGVFKSIYKSK